ncbi:hypothetical protein BMS3Bbin02_00328 [bacterium BMS3Bbin02]|nr:hypothetical protein BMS3Bbin02_00328 [bacterium BMS3Bbin02]
MDADGARHLGDAYDRVLDGTSRHHHQIVQLVDDHDNVRETVVAVLVKRAGVPFRPITPDVADARVGEQVVSAVHLRDCPLECVGCLLRIRNDPCQEMRNVVVLTEFDPLRIDHDEANILGLGTHQ